MMLVLMMMIMLFVMMSDAQPFVRNCLISDLICPFPVLLIGLSLRSSIYQFEICSSSDRRLLFLCLKSALPQFEICPPQFVFLWLSLFSLQNSHSLNFLLLPTNFFLLFGIWGKQDGTSNCAWGWRGQKCSSPALGSPQPPPGCHYFSLSSLSLPLLTNNNIS